MFKNLQGNKVLIFYLILFSIAGCSYINTEKLERVLATDFYELDTTPVNALRLDCDNKKFFYIRDLEQENNENSLKWVIFRDKEYRLAESTPNLYENKVLTLEYSGSIVQIFPKNKELTELLFTNCKFSQSD